MTRNRHDSCQGMNWLRPEKRLAIYLRDGLACAYCGIGIEQDAKLTLDHLKPHSAGGSNEAANLVTCCHRCNSSRGDRAWRSFASRVAGYQGRMAAQIVGHIQTSTRRGIDVAAAKELIARRGGVSAALATGFGS